MKQAFTGWLLASALSVAAQAQTTTPTQPRASRPTITDQSLVLDASGSTVPAVVWRGMLASGEYKLTSTPEYTEANPSFRLVALTAAEREARLARMPPPKESPFFTTGKVLPSFKLRDLNGRKFNSQELAGKIVVLNFWFINCGPCRREIPDLNEVVQHYANRDDVVFLAVALDERDAIKQFVQQRPYNYALIPGGRYVAEKYGVNTFPTNLVLDREGKVVFHTQFHPNIKHFLQQAIDGVK